MGFLHGLHDCMELFLSGLIYRILQILPCNRLVGGNFNDVHPVNVPEFPLFRKGCTCHARFFVKFIKEILEGNGGKSLAFPLYLYMLLCFNCLMETVGVPSARHDTSCKLVHYQHLVVLYHIILVPEHEIVCPKSQEDIVLDFDIFRIRQIFYLEELLHLVNALGGKVHHLVLFIDDKVAGFLPLHPHDGVHFG